MKSTMQKLVAETERLRLRGKITRIVYWSALGAVVVIALMKLYGSI